MSLRQSLGRVGRWPRLAASAACLLLAAVSAIEGSHATPHAGSRVAVVAVRTLPSGHTISARDLATTRASTVAPGAASHARTLIGRMLAGPVARGETITRLRLVDAGLTTGLGPGVVAMPVDVTTDVRGLVSPGGRVDLLAVAADRDGSVITGTMPRSSPAERLAARVLVLAALPPDTSADAGGCRLVLALDRDQALRIAGARSTRLFQVAALPP